MDVVDQLLDFLGSFKNAESMSPPLRAVLGVDTDLGDRLLAAAVLGRVVFVTGAAGSGKTHLLRTLPREDGIQLLSPDENPPASPYRMVVEDATELDAEERIRLTSLAGDACLATIVAINEGPLRATAEIPGGEAFGVASDLLHKAQRGLVSEYDSAAPTMIDMGAFDPLEQEVVTAILGKPQIAEAVRRSDCACSGDECPRKVAWRQLENPTVRSRVGRLLKMILLVESDWAFRDVWDFVADLVLGGSCDEDPPTSTWFWRLFYGGSRIAVALNEASDPESIAVPGVEQRLWYADWGALELELIDDVELLPFSRPDGDMDRFVWLKLQLLLMTTAEEIHQLLHQTVEHRLERAARECDTGPIIEAINAYMNYGMLAASAARLQLWIDHGIERRTKRSHGQILGGAAEAKDFVVRPSQVVVNHPDEGPPMIGSARFLVHLPSQAFLELSQEKLALLETRRTFRRADRRHTDLEWDLYSFFEVVLREAAYPHELGVLSCDFDSMKGDHLAYSVSLDAESVEQRP